MPLETTEPTVPHDITRLVGNRVATMIYIRRKGPSIATEIAAGTGVSRACMTNTLDLLERDKLIAPVHDADRRARRVMLTDHGLRIIEQTHILLSETNSLLSA